MCHTCLCECMHTCAACLCECMHTCVACLCESMHTCATCLCEFMHTHAACLCECMHMCRMFAREYMHTCPHVCDGQRRHQGIHLLFSIYSLEAGVEARLLFSQLIWKPASPSHPPASAYLGAGTIGVHEQPSLQWSTGLGTPVHWIVQQAPNSRAISLVPVCLKLIIRTMCGGCHGAHVEVRGQPMGVGSLLLPYGFQGSNLGHQAW